MAELAAEIANLKAWKKAVILAHNYQLPDVQDLADFVGDSLGLSVQASKTDARVIIFCGVDFMAETAAVLNPGKIVIHPAPEAMCPMSMMIDAANVRELRQQHPGAPVVSYVNTSAEVKAESDICCTSSNAVKVVQSLPDREAIFLPDRNLGMYVQRFVRDKVLYLWPGYCPTHQQIKKEDLLQLKKDHPRAISIVHPECTPDVIDVADKAFSTEGLVGFIRSSGEREFIIGTEGGLIHRLKKISPDKTYYEIPSAVCPTMKKITPALILKSLQTLEPRVTIEKGIMDRARGPIERMVNMGRGD
ncbi:MAG: quinolinate synthase NadA [Euryarchaeota archaeon]|nr:quinolinate synthase NadA [Euryarchaeota archaeon]